MKLRKIIAMAGVAALIVSNITGCKSDDSSSNNSDSSVTSVYGQVTSIDGSKIEIALIENYSSDSSADGKGGFGGKMEEMTDENGETITRGEGESKDFGGERPSMADGQTPADMQSMENGETPADMPSMADGETPANMPSMADGQTPPSDAGAGNMGGAGMMGGYTMTGETLTITLADESQLFIEENSETSSASISDITVGTVLKLDYADSDKTSISKITIMKSSNSSIGKPNEDESSLDKETTPAA